MYIDATIGFRNYHLTFRASFFWLWKPWYVWKGLDAFHFSTNLGLFEFEFRVPNTRKNRKLWKSLIPK